jgi:hypothetical protein
VDSVKEVCAMTEIQNTSLPVDGRTLLQVLTWLHAAGIEFVVDQMPYDELSIDPSEVMEYLANPETFLAEARGVSMEEYRAWQAAEGAIQCHAQTKSGSRCRNMIAESDHYLTPQMWAHLQAQQPTCRVHSSKVATTMKLMSDKNP